MVTNSPKSPKENCMSITEKRHSRDKPTGQPEYIGVLCNSTLQFLKTFLDVCFLHFSQSQKLPSQSELLQLSPELPFNWSSHLNPCLLVFGRQGSPPVGPGLVRSACMDGTQCGHPGAKSSRRHVLSLKPFRQGRAGMRHLEMEPGPAGWATGGWGQEWSRGRRTLKDVMWRGSVHVHCCGSLVYRTPNPMGCG